MRTFMRTCVVVSATVVGLLVIADGCRFSYPSPMHCFNNEGDEYCRARDAARPYCERGQDECISPNSDYGCVEQRPVDECYSPCGGRSTIAENGECVVVEDSSSGSSSEGTATEESNGSSSESSTTGPVPCMGNEDCPDGAAPFCEAVSGVCVACDGVEDPDGACAGADPGLPVCVGGTCVQCTAENPTACSGETPVCDAETNTCVRCTAHDQCGGAACNLFNGACLPADAVVHVGGTKPDFPNLGAALATFGTDEEWTVVVHAGMTSYDEAVTVDGGRVVAFLAAEIGPGIEPPRWVRTSGDEPQLTAGTGTTVLMDGVELSLNGSSAVPAVLVDGGRLWFDRGRVAQNNGIGIVAQNGAELWLERTRVVQNNGGGIVAQSNAELVLRNCFVGGGAQDVDAIALNDSNLDLLYTTVGGGGVLGGRARALFCDGATVADARNSILVSADPMPEVECAGVTLTTSATEAEIGMLNIMWFMGYATGDFHLTSMGATTFADIAQWQAGDPPTDIDGTPRPPVDGTLDYAGADIPSMAAARRNLAR